MAPLVPPIAYHLPGELREYESEEPVVGAEMKILYVIQDAQIGLNFGVRPYDPKHLPKYEALARAVNVRDELGWREKDQLQNILVKTDIWSDFPIDDARLVSWELKAGEEDQRIDLLYLTSSPELVPVELKLGGTSLDTHGQLLRYVADLHFAPWSLDRVREEHARYVARITNELVRERIHDSFEALVAGIPATPQVPVRRGGVIIDTAIRPQSRRPSATSTKSAASTSPPSKCAASRKQLGSPGPRSCG